MPSVLLLLPAHGLVGWHVSLLRALAAEGVDARVDWRPAPARRSAVIWLEALEETLIARRPIPSLQPVASEDGFAAVAGPSDFVFDLSGRSAPETGAIFPTCNEGVGDDAFDLALLDEGPPCLRLVQREGDRLLTIAEGLIAWETPGLFRCGREALCKRLATLILMIVRRGPGFAIASIADGTTFRRFNPGTYLAASLTARATNRIARLAGAENNWFVAWRRLVSETDSIQAHEAWPHTTWTRLPDDGRRYYADPFLFENKGTVHVFCEEYPYATGKGVIAHFEIDKSGAVAGPTRVVLEASAHLSYPNVFRHGGEIWMMPESAGARNLVLYRADPFPYRWVPDRVLIEDLVLADATIIEHDGRHWLLATTSEEGGSSWDCLSVFVAASPLGPWRRCYGGPALVDASAARPAGNAFRRGNQLWRPSQDCRRLYGGGIALCRVDHLGEDTFRQTVMARIGPPPGFRAAGAHTLNVAAGYEAIDIFGPRSN